jgi:hypothetical protein
MVEAAPGMEVASGVEEVGAAAALVAALVGSPELEVVVVVRKAERFPRLGPRWFHPWVVSGADSNRVCREVRQ